MVSIESLNGVAKFTAYAGSSIPIFGDVLKAYDNVQYMDDYMSKRNMSWDDVKYPTKVVGAGSIAGAGMSFVSANIRNFY